MNTHIDATQVETATVARVEQNQDKSLSSTSDLAASSGLSRVDYKSFCQAQIDAAGDSKSAHLPELYVPLALDKGVLAAHDKLTALVDGSIGNAEARQKFRTAIAAFEHRADAQGLTPDQVKETYKQLDRMLTPAPGSPFTSEQRQQLVCQWMERLADPTAATRQGWHDTCGWTYLETRLLSKNPDKVTEKMAEVITSGTVTTLDARKAQQMEAEGKAGGPLPLKHLKLGKGSLQPDLEAQGRSSHSDRRDYVDQIAQVMEANLSWDANTVTPTGEVVAPGTIHYNQRSLIERPGDPLPNGQRADKSGESVSYIDPETKQRVVFDDHGYGFGGGAKPSDLALVNGLITGKSEQMLLQRPVDDDDLDPKSGVSITSVAQLKTQLEKMQKEGSFPFGVKVEEAQPGVVEDYLARHPEKTASQVPKNGWHAIAVTGLDAQGNVQIYNPWGVKRTMTPEQLFKAMTKPG
jgi:hypothetical protein